MTDPDALWESDEGESVSDAESLAERLATLRRAWAEFRGYVTHDHRCDAWKDQDPTDPKCDCGVRVLVVALEGLTPRGWLEGEEREAG